MKTVYLAGKVDGRKHQVVATLNGEADFVCSDGGNHSEHGWGYGAGGGFDSAYLRSMVRGECCDLISDCHYLIAYLDEPTSYGSIAEIAYASGKGYHCYVFILHSGGTPEQLFDAYWLVSYFPNVQTTIVASEAEATREIRRIVRRHSYREYLSSDDWKERRKVALERAGHRCQTCNAASPLQVHHRTYERVGRELPEDLIALCGKCHEKFHDIKRID